MRAAAMWTVATCLLVLAMVPASRADLVDDERRAQWELWREEPLDLRSASEQEIEMLPGSDARLAASVVALREADRLPADLDALVALLSATTELAEQWRDLVTLSPPRGGFDAGGDLRTALIADDRAAAELRGVLRGHAGPVRGSLGGRSSAPGPSRGWGAVESGGVTLVAGHLRPRTGEGLLLADGAQRSRTGPVRAPALPRLDGRSGTAMTRAPTGLGAMWAGSVQQAWVASLRTERGDPIWAGAAARSGAHLDAGFAWSTESAGTRVSFWTAQGRPRGPAWWASLAVGRGDAISHAGARWAGSGWRVGSAFTRAPAPAAAGHDPISGSSLDRPHRSWQIDGALHQRGWSLEVLARHVTRGTAAVDDSDERGRLRWEWRPPAASRDRARWRASLEVGIDESLVDAGGDADPANTTQRASLERSSGVHRLVVVWRRAGRVGQRQEAIAVRAGLDRLVRWTAAVAIATGQRSTPWSVLQPGWGTAPLWVEPGGVALSAGARALEAGRFDFGFWAWWRDGPRSGDEGGGGVSLRLGLGPAGAIVAR